MNRQLDGFAAAATRTHDYAPFLVVVTAALDGGPSSAELGEALAALQAREPLLRVRIASSGRRHRFEAAEIPPIPLVVRERRAEDDLWLQVVEEELNRRIEDRTGPLMRCTYLPPAGAGGRAEIVLSFHHAIVDAVSAIGLVGRLLGRCAAGGGAELPEAGPLISLKERLPRRFRGPRGLGLRGGFLLRQLGDEASHRLFGPSPSGPASRTTRCHPLAGSLDRAETSALVRATRRRRVTLKSALDAAALLAVKGRLSTVGGRRLRYMTFADLRPYCEPPLRSETMGAFVTLMRHSIEMEDGGDFWSLARRITWQVEVAMRRGDKFASVMLADTMMRIALAETKHRMATVAVSYTGPVRLDAQYGSMRLRTLHGFVSNFGLGPPLTASARLVGDELVFDLVYLDSDMDRSQAEALLEDVLQTLRLAGEDRRR